MLIAAELHLVDVENVYGIETPKWMIDLYKPIYTTIVGMIVDRVNNKLVELNKQAKQLGLEGSFDLDAPYNVFMRNEMQKIADEFMMEATGGSKTYSGNGMNYTFEIDKNFVWHMKIYSEIYGIKQDMYTSIPEKKGDMQDV